jgi:hypothetical protein
LVLASWRFGVCTKLVWFRTSPHGSYLTDYRKRNIAEEAYKEAVAYLELELAGDSAAQAFLSGTVSIEDVSVVVKKAEESYHNASPKTKKAQKWLREFSSRMIYYSQVMDMLAQHHPEYVALAWGAVKLVLVVRIFT